MVLSNGEINIIADMEGTTGVKLHNNRQKLRARFDIIKKLGQGTYGKVQLAINKDSGEEVAIKTIKKSKIETEQDLIRIQREIQIMSSVQHPHIIHIYEVFENREKIVLVMEYASGGELYDFLSFKKVLEEPEARRVFRQVASAVFYCHKNMICHRDLKLENILLDERGSAKIADFGLSNVFDERHFLSTFCGSPLYASPEIVRGTPYYGPEVDCWSLGVLLYTLVYGAMPFDGSNFKKLVRQISEGDYYEPKVPSEASNLIRRMLTVDPAKRANIDDICCDIWVDLGEDVPLFDIAKDMCKQMPVRLDYLLALTATAPHPPADLPLPPESAAAAGATPDVERNEGDDIGERFDRAEEEMDTEMAEGGGASQRKHKLETSSSLIGSNAKLSSRKKKKPHSEENEDDEDGDGAAEKVIDRVEVSNEDQKLESTEVNESKQTAEEEVGGEREEVVATVTDESEVVSKPEMIEELDSEKNSTADTTKIHQTGSLVKRKPSTIKKAVTSSAVTKLKSNSIAEATKGLPPSENQNGARMPKLKKSLSIGKEGNANTTQSSPVGSPDKRKTSLTSSRITDAKKAFEAKASTEKKPLGVVGAKVSSVRKAFESPPTTPEGSKMTKSPLSRKNSNAPDESKLEEDRENVPMDGKKPLVRQGSRKGVTRTTSPTKTMRTPLISGQHHNGCVPHEAKVAALAAQEAKKSSTSPPKSIQRKSPPTSDTSSARKNSLSKTSSLVKSTSGSVSRQRNSTVGTSCRTAATTRPRSPVKVARPSTSSQKSKVVEETLGDKEPAPTDGDEESLSKSAETPSNLQSVEEDHQTTEVKKTINDTEDEVKEEEEEKDKAEDDSGGNVDVGKRGSIEIAPLSPSSSLACRRKQMEDIDDAEDSQQENSPQIRFIPRDQGQFTLLGVKSEVVFDVGDDMSHQSAITPPPQLKSIEPVSGKPETKKHDGDEEDPSKIIRYVATVRRHGSEDNDPVAKGPERVTLLKIRRSETGMNVGPGSPDSGVPCDDSNPSTPEVWNTQTSKTKEISKTPDGIIEEKKSEVEQTSLNTEQRGYNVYRSKYRSVQKYRSVVEKRDGDNNEGAALSEEPSIERSDSFSSTGSTDDMEDVFENLTSESLFTSLLSRTRHLIDRLTDGDTYASRWFQSGLIGRRSLGLASTSTSFFDAPNVSFIRNPINTATNWRNYGVSRDYLPSDVGYVVEGGSSGNRVRRWRSSTRSGDEEEDPAFMSDTGSMSRLRSGNLRLRARASFNTHTEAGGYNNGYGSSIPFISARSTLSSGGPLRQSRYDSFRGQDVDFPSTNTTRREEARSDIISALLHHRNRSLDGRRPHSLYEESDEPCSSTSSTTQSRQRRGQEEEWSESGQEVSKDKSSSLYGTVRRPQRDQRYTKSISKELDEKSDDTGGLRRPRSVLVLSDPNQEDSVSVSRDYSKSVSKTGNTKKEEEEEYEREHRVTEDEVGRSVTTTRRECKRSVSRTDDDKSCSSSLHVHTSSSSLRRPIKKQPSDEDPGLSRQDSGIGSLYDSVPSTPISVSSQGRRGILKFARSVSNELESLEEEISRIGLQRPSQQQETTARQNSDESSDGRRRNVSQSEGCSTGTATDGTSTPASDSAETGSVCSDGAGTETSSSTVKASEEESVGERIRRKSFFARFNETSRIPRKGRKSSSGSPTSSTSSASLRSDLNRSSSLRHRHVFDDDGLGGFVGGGRMSYDPAADFYPSSSRLPHRWSMHLGNGGGLSDAEFLPYDTAPQSPRRGSLQSVGGGADVLSFLRRPDCGSSSWIDDGSSFEMPSSGRSTSPMSRTRSLPEEGNPPSGGRPVLRQQSMPSNSTGMPPPSSARRPSHLGLYPRNVSQPHSPSAVPFEESGELSSPEASSHFSGARSSWRPPSSTNPRTTSSSSSLGDPLEGYETNAHRRPVAGTLASLMDSLDSPSEVLQKAMDLCDSLRYT